MSDEPQTKVEEENKDEDAKSQSSQSSKSEEYNIYSQVGQRVSPSFSTGFNGICFLIACIITIL